MDEESSSRGAPFSTAFDIGGALSDGWRCLKLSPWPLLVGGLLMTISEGNRFNGNGLSDLTRASEGSGSGSGDAFEDLLRDLSPNLWNAGPAQGPRPLAVLGEAFGLGGSEIALVGVLLGVLVVAVVVAIGLFVLRCWVQTGYIRLHREVLETGAGSFRALFSGADRFWHMALTRGYLAFTGLGPAQPGGGPSRRGRGRSP